MDSVVIRHGQRGQRAFREEMLESRKKVLNKVVQFTGLSPDNQRIEEAAERGTFANMQKDEAMHGAEAYLKIPDKRENFIRRGQKDGWKDEMNLALAMRIEEAFAPAMKAVGYL